jgi:excisionase family DNA binding protein
VEWRKTKEKAMQEKRITAPTDHDDELLTVEEAAKIAKLSPRTIDRWIKKGMVPAYGPARCTRVLLCEVLPRRTRPVIGQVV